MVENLSMFPTSSSSLIFLVLATLLVYLVCLAIYRLYLSPIAYIPGPKLAALTQWYETYYDVYLDGQFTLHQMELHKKYGPIVRINPWEVHINDPEFYETIYSTTSPFSKVPAHEAWQNADTAAETTISHDLHRLRRAPMSSFFSKRSILRYTSEIQARADKLCSRLNNEYRGSGKVLHMNSVLGCFAADTITEYAFAKDYKYLDAPDFQPRFVKTMQDLGKAMHFLMLFPWVMKLLVSLPEWFVQKLNPAMGEIFAFQAMTKEQILDIKAGRNEAHKDASHPTILKKLIDSNLPPHEKTMQRLHHEGQVIVGAGLETMKTVLCTAFFHILDKLDIHQRLEAELSSIWPDIDTPPTLPKLESLPYFTSVIQEALRLSYGAAFRLPRTSSTPIQYKSYTIPAGTPFSMSIYHLHHNETIFANSHTFDPTRFLPDPTTGRPPVILTPDGSEKSVTRYLNPFSRGTRQCLGMHLAWAEMYICLANLVRRCEFELFETSERNVRMFSEHFIPMPHPESEGIRVLVLQNVVVLLFDWGKSVTLSSRDIKIRLVGDGGMLDEWLLIVLSGRKGGRAAGTVHTGRFAT